MYVRWKTKKLTGSRKSGGRSLYAVLVSSERREGQPRQKVIKHLGYINEGQLEDVEHRRRFWRQVGIALAAVTMEPAIRARVEAKLAGMVPNPTSLGTLRDEQGRFLIDASMLSALTDTIDWRGEFRHLPEGSIEIESSDHRCLIISPSTFSSMDPLTRSRIKSIITIQLVLRSYETMCRVATACRYGA